MNMNADLNGRMLGGERRSQKRGWLAVSVLAAISTASAATDGLSLTGNQLTAGRLSFLMGSNALPAQITIAAATEEIPLESRKPDAAKLSDQDLLVLGRGPQLKAPLRVEAVTSGKPVTLTPAEFTPPTLNNETATSKAKLVGAGVIVAVESALGRDGALSVKITYSGGKVESLALAMEMNGVVDTVVSGGAPFGTNDVSLGDEEGLLWGNAVPVAGAAPTAANRGAPGLVPHLFWGSGDRGWTWLAEGDRGWLATSSAPTMTLTRDKTGAVVWRAFLVNQPADLKGDRTATFTLLTHPATVRATDHRKAMWLDWPFAGKAAQTPPLNAKGRAGVSGLVRADAGSLTEATAGAVLLEGPAGGAAASAAKTLADTYSPGLFRYLAGTHTGVGGRLLANSPQLVKPGQSPACDRMVLGRALLHDIGVDPAGVTHLAMAATVLNALSQFGYFRPDGQTEYIPYWRTQGLVRYGEIYDAKDAFQENATDPMGRVRVSVWRRPADGGTGAKALFLIVNEGDAPVREQFYLLSPVKLFGGLNELTYRDCVARWDVSSLPVDSDWAGITKGGFVAATGQDREQTKRSGKFLLDVEDLGGTPEVANKNGIQVYGRTFVPARGFRLLLGSAGPKTEEKDRTARAK